MQILCAICCEVFTNDNLKQVCSCPCGHIFHSGCINQWFEREKTCPECRQEVKDKNLIHLFFNVEVISGDSEDTIESLKIKLDDLNCQLYSKEADVKFLKHDNESLSEQIQKLSSRLKEIQNSHQITVSTLENRTQCLNAVKRRIEELDETHKRLKTEEQEIIRVQKREIDELTRINELLRQKLNADYQNLDDSELPPFNRGDFDAPGSSSFGLKPHHKFYRNMGDEETGGYPFSSLAFPYKHQDPLGGAQPISLVKKQPYHGHPSRSHSDQPIPAHHHPSSYLPHSSKSQFHSQPKISHLPPHGRARSFDSPHLYPGQLDLPSSSKNVPKSDLPFYGFPSSSSSQCPPWLAPMPQSGFLNSSEGFVPPLSQRYSSSYQYPKEQDDIVPFPSSWVLVKQ
ncbi:unnamed protein product [Bemisia tabaci]|uniref:RING-type domain-containing protein n=1 Tax=Bemisia tabaci TaxID=7038 RepID=A0A9P0AIV1_BEMTA|nr:unnamed protein product [Bemisia tabaci]